MEKEAADAETPPSNRPVAAPRSADAQASAQALGRARLESLREAREHADRLIRELQHMAPAEGPITSGQARRIHQALQQLVGHGAAAVPSLRDFLQSYQDANFADAEGGDQVGYDTLRLGLLDVLGQIAGLEAETVLLDQLQTSGEPVEVALLADLLEERAPGEHQEKVLRAAVETLEFVSQQRSTDAALAATDRVDVAPLFEVLQAYPDDHTAAWLKTLARGWSNYAPLALANLPQDQGVPELIQMVQAPTALNEHSGRFAMRVLAQVAADSPTAQEVLLEKVEENQIPERLWPILGEVVAGADQLQMEPPNPEAHESSAGSGIDGARVARHTVAGPHPQIVYSVDYSGLLPAEDVERRLALIDRMLQITDDPAALAALQRAESLLLGRGY